MNRILRQLRGAVGNSLVWGASWFGGAFATMAALWSGARPWDQIFAISSYLGITGFITGGAVAVLLRLAYRGRGILEIKAGRFSLAGAAIAALCSPVLFGVDQMLLGLWVDSGSLIRLAFAAGVFGAVTAGTTILLAQGSARALSSTAEKELAVEQEGVAALLVGKAE